VEVRKMDRLSWLILGLTVLGLGFSFGCSTPETSSKEALIVGDYEAIPNPAAPPPPEKGTFRLSVGSTGNAEFLGVQGKLEHVKNEQWELTLPKEEAKFFILMDYGSLEGDEVKFKVLASTSERIEISDGKKFKVPFRKVN
jgi:hypothetical protein